MSIHENTYRKEMGVGVRGGRGSREEEEDEGGECKDSRDNMKNTGDIWGCQQQSTIFKTFLCRSNGSGFSFSRECWIDTAFSCLRSLLSIQE